MMDDDDFLLFDGDDDEDGVGLPTNVLALGYPAETSHALSIRERAARGCADFAGAAMVLFEDTEGEFLNAEAFQAAMRSARPPTIEAAGAWLQERRSAVDRVVWAATAGDG